MHKNTNAPSTDNALESVSGIMLQLASWAHLYRSSPHTHEQSVRVGATKNFLPAGMHYNVTTSWIADITEMRISDRQFLNVQIVLINVDVEEAIILQRAKYRSSDITCNRVELGEGVVRRASPPQDVDICHRPLTDSDPKRLNRGLDESLALGATLPADVESNLKSCMTVGEFSSLAVLVGRELSPVDLELAKEVHQARDARAACLSP